MTQSALKLISDTDTEIPFQDASIDIWDTKYRLKTKDGDPVDQSIADTYYRVAKTLAEVETDPEKKTQCFKDFLWALEHGAIPAGRIMSNAGALDYKPATSTINCTVSGVIGDSMDDILDKVHEAGLTLKAGCGIGYEFSTLRPKDAYVSGAGAYTSGPLSFMDIYDKMCFTVSSAGGRRGAQMSTFDVSHPDVVEYIRAKRENGRLRQFNLSLLITKEFIKAVQDDAIWPLSFPVTKKQIELDRLDVSDPDQVIWREIQVTGEDYLVRVDGFVACKITKTIPAKRLWDIIMSSTYDFAEPGFILIDKVNEMNNNWFCENIRTTNPCGEQPLPPYGSCLLGSINLTKFVKYPFTDRAYFDWDTYRKVIRIFSRMLDNVVEINGLPLQKQQDEIISKRRHGMGYLGLGSTMTMLKMKYGDEASLDFTTEITKTLAHEGWKAALDLAKEKGPAPIMETLFPVTTIMLHQRPEMVTDGYQVGDQVPGKILHAKYSRYMQQLKVIDPELIEELAQIGARYTHHSSIAPTGCINGRSLIINENGLQRITDMGNPEGEQWQDIAVDVSTDEGFKSATKFFINGHAKTLRLRTRSGREFEATPNHQIRILDTEFGYIWRRMDELKPRDLIITAYDNYPTQVKEISLQSVNISETDQRFNTFFNPTVLTPELSEFIGLLQAIGNIKSDRHLRFFHHIDYSDDTFDRLSETLYGYFGIEVKITQSTGDKGINMKELHVYSKSLVDWLRLNDFDKPVSNDIQIPKKILEGGRDNIYGYLRGLFEGNGSCDARGYIKYTSTSKSLIHDLQILLQSVGIVSIVGISNNGGDENRFGNNDVWALSIGNLIDRVNFKDRIGFISTKGIAEPTSSRNFVYRQLQSSKALMTYRKFFKYFNAETVKRFMDDYLSDLDIKVFMDEIIEIVESECETYDLSVPDNVTYIANNIVSHNTISLSLANNASNGIEPSFAHHYSRNVIRAGKKSKEKVDVFSFELLAYRALVNSDAMPYSDDPAHQLPDYFISAETIEPKQHVDVQAAAQVWIDSSISKTANVPTDYPYEDFKSIYEYAYEKGLKGCTTFRFNPEAFQGVLVKEQDLANTTYQFTLEDGHVVEFKGNEEVEYDGEIHTAANLFDALKEGYYGKF